MRKRGCIIPSLTRFWATLGLFFLRPHPWRLVTLFRGMLAFPVTLAHPLVLFSALLALSALLLLPLNTVLASFQASLLYQFRLTKGKGVAVCEAYLERLNTTAYQDPPYNAAGRNILRDILQNATDAAGQYIVQDNDPNTGRSNATLINSLMTLAGWQGGQSLSAAQRNLINQALSSFYGQQLTRTKGRATT